MVHLSSQHPRTRTRTTAHAPPHTQCHAHVPPSPLNPNQVADLSHDKERAWPKRRRQFGGPCRRLTRSSGTDASCSGSITARAAALCRHLTTLSQVHTCSVFTPFRVRSSFFVLLFLVPLRSSFVAVRFVLFGCWYVDESPTPGRVSSFHHSRRRTGPGGSAPGVRRSAANRGQEPGGQGRLKEDAGGRPHHHDHQQPQNIFRHNTHQCKKTYHSPPTANCASG
jgi:hypothetical protein